MRREYTLKSGKTLYCWYSQYSGLTIYTDETGAKKELTLEVDRGNPDPVVEYHGETIHVNDFKFIGLDELIQKVSEAIASGDRVRVLSDEALATIMKEHDRVGFVMLVDCFDTVVPGLGFGLKSSNNRMEALMVPFEKYRKMEDWHYKIELQAADEASRLLVGKEDMYFQDLWTSVMCGHIKLVDKNKYMEEHGCKIPEDVHVTVLNI